MQAKRWGLASAVALALILGLAVGCASRSGPTGTGTAGEAATEPTTETRYAASNEVELYGRHSCSICRGFVERLERDGVEYTFHDVDESEAVAEEMWLLVLEHDPRAESVRLPVVHVNGHVMISPPYESFQTRLRTN